MSATLHIKDELKLKMKRVQQSLQALPYADQTVLLDDFAQAVEKRFKECYPEDRVYGPVSIRKHLGWTVRTYIVAVPPEEAKRRYDRIVEILVENYLRTRAQNALKQQQAQGCSPL